MNLEEKVKEIEKKISGKILLDENLSKYSWFNLGGQAKVVFKPKNLIELTAISGGSPSPSTNML